MRKPAFTTVQIPMQCSDRPEALIARLKDDFNDARTQVEVLTGPDFITLRFFTTDLSDVCEILNDHELL